MCVENEVCSSRGCPARSLTDFLALVTWEWGRRALSEVEPLIRVMCGCSDSMRSQLDNHGFSELAHSLRQVYARLDVVLSNLSPEHRITALQKGFLARDMHGSLYRVFQAPSRGFVCECLARRGIPRGQVDHEADDIINGVWARIWETRLPTYNNQLLFEHYYFRMLCNATEEWFRKRNRRTWYRLLDNFDPYLVRDDPAPLEGLRDAIEDLSDPHRACLVLRLQGHSPAEIARALDTTLRRVYLVNHQAYQMLRRSLLA